MPVFSALTKDKPILWGASGVFSLFLPGGLHFHDNRPEDHRLGTDLQVTYWVGILHGVITRPPRPLCSAGVFFHEVVACPRSVISVGGHGN